MIMSIAKKETAEPLSISEDTARLIRLFDKNSEIFSEASAIISKHRGEDAENPQLNKLLDALQGVDDAISDLIGYSVQYHYKGVMGDVKCRVEV